jgi:spermidine synthase
VSAGVGRGLVLVAVFACAACGLVYELELVALATSLVGDSVTQASIVLSVMVFAMGIGSLLAKRMRCHAVVGFGLIEAMLALVGGGSALALYASFAWLGASRGALVVFSLLIGVLIGAEMPLLMTLIQRIRAQDPGGALADLFAADYVGALVGGLMFPFLLLPFFGQLTGALLTGVVNALAGGVVVLWLFRRELSLRGRWALLALNAVAVALLVAGAACVGPFEQAARQAVYGPHVRVAVRTDVQEIVLTGSPAAPGTGGGGAHGGQLGFFLDGRMRACSADVPRYQEALVDPAMAGGRRARVLILGGGDGLALHEVLAAPGVRSVTVVDHDAGVVRLARSDPGLSRLNGHAFTDPRVRVVTADAFRWLRDRPPGAKPFDVVLADLPEPGDKASAKLYSQEFYGLAARALAPGGRLAVHAGSAGTRPHDYWTAVATIGSVGLRTTPYDVGGRSCPDGPDDWGFVLAAAGPQPPVVGEAARGGGRSQAVTVSASALQSAARRAARARPQLLPPPSTLMHPRYAR